MGECHGLIADSIWLSSFKILQSVKIQLLRSGTHLSPLGTLDYKHAASVSELQIQSKRSVLHHLTQQAVKALHQ